jgi:hypothetical protein
MNPSTIGATAPKSYPAAGAEVGGGVVPVGAVDVVLVVVDPVIASVVVGDVPEAASSSSLQATEPTTSRPHARPVAVRRTVCRNVPTVVSSCRSAGRPRT